MPTGIPRKYLHCRKCEGSKFETVSDLRTHQWSVHPETFDALRFAAKKVNQDPAIQARKKAKMRAYYRKLKKKRALIKAPVVKLIKETANGDMRVSDLLTELKRQQKFISDMVSLIESMSMSPKEAQ